MAIGLVCCLGKSHKSTELVLLLLLLLYAFGDAPWVVKNETWERRQPHDQFVKASW